MWTTARCVVRSSVLSQLTRTLVLLLSAIALVGCGGWGMQTAAGGRQHPGPIPTTSNGTGADPDIVAPGLPTVDLYDHGGPFRHHTEALRNTSMTARRPADAGVSRGDGSVHVDESGP